MRTGWTAFAILMAGGLLGAGAAIVTTEANRLTSSDTVCTSCHTMAIVAADLHFKDSAHENNSAGFRASCADCHVPPGNWFEETYSHLSQGLRDVVAEYTHDFSDPAVWQKRRAELAPKVSDDFRRNDGVNCRKCHDAAAIRPTTEAGRSAHAQLQKGSATCIDCHTNLVHAPTASSARRFDRSGLAAIAK
jgi:nitrate/TMAO reductase-like tetraheme cytochrome c subunit